MDCRIRAFGACMIGGFPHRYEDSFFHLAVERLRLETWHHLIPSHFTLGGFPITRVPKHLPARCLSADPDIVVLQFGTSDLIVPIRKDRRHSGGGNSAAQRIVLANPATLAHRLRWMGRSLFVDALRLPPVTPPEIYLASMVSIVQMFLAHHVVPVVMSPFVFGGWRSNRFARESAERLQAAMTALPRAVYVDAYAALARQPRGRMLLGDGTHLSLAGQQVVADALFPCLKNLVENQAWFVDKPSRPVLPEKSRQAP